MPKIRNIIIFISIAAVFILIYLFFVRKPEMPETNLITSSNTTLPSIDNSGANAVFPNADSKIAENFLTLLLSVRNISLNDSIFDEMAWSNLKDSSIVLIPDGTEGRPNPFAPLGYDSASVPPPAPASPSSGTGTP